MSPSQRVVECPICGHEMAIPPGYENATGHCRVCGGVVSASSSSPASRLEKTMRAARLKPEPTFSERLHALVDPVLHGLVGGLIGALAGGAVMGGIMLLFRDPKEKITLAGLFANADTGILVGFVVCSCWAVIRRLVLGPLPGAVLGASVGLAMGTLTHVLESVFVTPPDMPLWGTAIISAAGGAVAGCIMGVKFGASD